MKHLTANVQTPLSCCRKWCTNPVSLTHPHTLIYIKASDSFAIVPLLYCVLFLAVITWCIEHSAVGFSTPSPDANTVPQMLNAHRHRERLKPCFQQFPTCSSIPMIHFHDSDVHLLSHKRWQRETQSKH